MVFGVSNHTFQKPITDPTYVRSNCGIIKRPHTPMNITKGINNPGIFKVVKSSIGNTTNAHSVKE